MGRGARWVVVLCALAMGPGTATARAVTPQTGIWEGQTGDARLHLQLTKSGSHTVAHNWVLTCAGSAAVYRTDTDNKDNPDIVFGSDGRPRPYKEFGRTISRFEGRLSRTTGTLTTGLSTSISGAGVRHDCSDPPIELRRVAAAPGVRDGHYTVTTTGRTSDLTDAGGDPKASFYVVGAGGALLDSNGRWGGPLAGRDLGFNFFCDINGGGGFGTIDTTGAFTVTDSYGELAASGAFSSQTTAAGGYQIHRTGNFACESGAQSFTALLDGAAGPEGPAPGAGGGTGPAPSGGATPPSGACVPAAHVGAVDISGVCLVRKGSIITARGAARINGIDFQPVGSGHVEIDVAHLAIKAEGRVQVKAGDLVLFEGSGSWSASKAFTFTRSASATLGALKGLPVKGEVTGSWVPAGASLHVNVSLGPDFGDITGQATIAATMADGLKLDALAVRLDESDLKLFSKLVIHSAAIAFDGPTDTWAGDISLELPGGKGVAGSLAIEGGHFKSATAEASNLNLPLGEVLFLQKIGVGVAVDPLKLSGSVGFTGGPELRAFGRDLSALEGDGSFAWESGGAFDTWTLGGSLKLASLDLGNASVVYRTGLDVTLHGELGFQILKAGFTGTADGWIGGRTQFQAEADGSLSLPVIGGFDAKAIVSSLGLGACGSKKVLFGHVGGGVTYRWGADGPHLFTGGCDFGDVAAAQSSQAGVPTGRTLRGRPDAGLLVIRGRGGAPQVSVTGPGGFAVASAPGGAVLTDRAYLLESPDEQTTYVVLNAPGPGRYDVTAQAGSVPLAQITTAPRLREPKVSAVVARGARGTRLLRYRATGLNAGQRVQFVERGTGVAHVLGTRRGGRGTLRFRPTGGVAERRTVQAVFTYKGVPRRTLTVAGFRVGASRAGRASRVRLRRGTRSRLAVTWRAGRGVVGSHEVRLTLRDGRRLLRVARPGTRSVTFSGITRRDRGTVSVIALGLGRQRAGAAHAALRARR